MAYGSGCHAPSETFKTDAADNAAGTENDDAEKDEEARP